MTKSVKPETCLHLTIRMSGVPLEYAVKHPTSGEKHTDEWKN